MLEEARDTGEIIERVAALDIGKAELVCCVRVPDAGRPGRRLQEVTPHSTMTRSLLVLADRLRGLGVTRVVMEATSVYWKAPFYLLEAAGFEVWLVNARGAESGSGGRYTLCYSRARMIHGGKGGSPDCQRHVGQP